MPSLSEGNRLDFATRQRRYKKTIESILVKIVDFTTLQEIESDWISEDYVSLLDAVEFGDTAGLSDAELREVCLM